MGVVQLLPLSAVLDGDGFEARASSSCVICSDFVHGGGGGSWLLAGRNRQ